MLNSMQFSSAKSLAESKMLQSLVFNEDKVRKGYSEFKADAKKVTDVFNEQWLRVEYDCAVNLAVQGELFRRYREDSDLFGFWRYLETTSTHPREEHLLLVGNIYKIGDPEGDMVHPSNGYNCNCSSEQLSDADIDEGGLSVRTNNEAKSDLEDVAPQFRFCPADHGPLPSKGHSYFEALPNANDADISTYDE